MSFPNIKYRSGDFTVEKYVGYYSSESPFLPEIQNVIVFRLPVEVDTRYYSGLPLNTINPDLGTGVNTAYMVGDSPREDIGGGLVKFTRTWARICQSYIKNGGTYQAIFPGVVGWREKPVKLPVAITIQRDFFLVDSGGTFPNFYDIPIIKGFTPYYTATGAADIIPQDYENYFLNNMTTPTAANYIAMAGSGDTIDLEDSKLSVFMGNIYMRERYLVPAI